ncbi:MAG: vitamin B12 dependent-methionine synthase activation domain-containing protein [Candidatus Zixiibacteriota bacterium]
MRMILDIPPERTIPGEQAVLSAQGIPSASVVASCHADLAKQALAVYRSLARPAGIIHELSRADFAVVYAGEGCNDSPAPVEQIYPLCDRLALFSVTLGEEICGQISGLFALHEFALGAMLDAAASEGTELTAEYAESYYADHCIQDNPSQAQDLGILRFSPGYCGWDTSGQKRLFGVLKPEEIGITLNASCLMHPLKSISGVILVGPGTAFAFEDDYAFCRLCETHSCRERLARVVARQR